MISSYIKKLLDFLFDPGTFPAEAPEYKFMVADLDRIGLLSLPIQGRRLRKSHHVQHLAAFVADEMGMGTGVGIIALSAVNHADTDHAAILPELGEIGINCGAGYIGVGLLQVTVKGIGGGMQFRRRQGGIDGASLPCILGFQWYFLSWQMKIGQCFLVLINHKSALL
jgi:hypothetical protein